MGPQEGVGILPGHRTWGLSHGGGGAHTMGYGRQAGGTHPTGMLSC